MKRKVTKFMYIAKLVIVDFKLMKQCKVGCNLDLK
jgi:hypothetical protein